MHEMSFPHRWLEKMHDAYVLKQKRAASPDALIEISAQHPLKDGIKPNAEFETRLQKGMELYRAMQNDVRRNVYLLVPGSRHRHDAHVDRISLSKAGTDFLEDQGIPPEHIYGEELIERFKGSQHRWPGIYNSADEAYLASETFKDNDEFGVVFSIVSRGQALRKQLHFLGNGVLPEMVSLSVHSAYHSIFKELVTTIPYTVLIDPDWQSERSLLARKSRSERMVQE